MAANLLLLQSCSCTSWTKFWGGDPGQECLSHWEWKQKEKQVVAVEEMEVEAMAPCTAPRLVETSRGYTAEGRAGREISLVKMAPEEITVNEAFDYRMKITNLTDQELLNVVVTDVKPDHMKIISSDPEMEIVAGQMSWAMGALAPNASKTISVNAMALRTETILTCAEVTYDTPTCAKVEVVEPKLRLAKHAPEKSLKCDRIPIRYTVTNVGTGHACNITISDKFSEGMVTSEGIGEVSFQIDSLGPGQTREFDVTADATKTGVFASKAMLTSRVGGSAESDLISTNVGQPVLEINESCPANQYIGRTVAYDITVTNRSDEIAKATIVEALVPETTRFQSATDDGMFTHSSPGKVTWNIGSLMPNSSKTVSMKLSSERAGTIITEANAKAFCADSVSTSCQTSVTGIPGILLEVVDTLDPIEVGDSETYIITVTNQGSADDTNIKITCKLENTMMYVSSSGPTVASAVGRTITFAPLASLAPKAQAKWRLNVKAVSIGDVRLKVSMISDQLTRPVEETEATRFYE